MKNVEIFFLNVLPEDRHWNWNVYFIFTFCSKKTLSGGVTHGKWPLPAEPYPGKCSHSVNHVSRKVHGHFPGYGSRKAIAKHKEKSATTPLFYQSFVARSLSGHYTPESGHFLQYDSRNVSTFWGMVREKWIKIRKYLSKIAAKNLKYCIGWK